MPQVPCAAIAVIVTRHGKRTLMREEEGRKERRRRIKEGKEDWFTDRARVLILPNA